MYVNSLPVVMVIVAAYNGVHWLEEQLKSILSQHGVQVRICVSVDPSSDGTEALVAQWARDDERIDLLPCAGKFGGAGRNFYRLLADVDLSAVDYLALSDQDDIWQPDKLYRAHLKLSNDGYSAYSSNVLAFWPDGRECLINKAQRQTEYDYLFEAAGPGSTYVFDYALACSIQEFILSHRLEVEQVNLHDWLLYAFVRSRNDRWYIDPYPGVLYRQHGSNQLGANSGYRAFKSRIRSVYSGWYAAEVGKIAQLCCVDSNPIFQFMPRRGWQRRWQIICHFRSCRRRLRDQIFLLFCCLIGLY